MDEANFELVAEEFDFQVVIKERYRVSSDQNLRLDVFLDDASLCALVLAGNREIVLAVSA